MSSFFASPVPITGSNIALNVFAKSAIAGSVKTRMQPQLSARDCTRLHKALVRYTLQMVEGFDYAGVHKILFLTGNASEVARSAAAFAVPDCFDIDLQVGNDLGDRMTHVLLRQFDAGFRKVVFIGTDNPLLGPKHLAAAITALSSFKVVLGPARDGGYYLIGFSACVPAILQDISWGTPRVYRQTVELLEHHRIGWKRLRQSFDLDTFEDLQKLNRLLEVNSSLVGSPHGSKLRDLVSKLLRTGDPGLRTRHSL